MIYILDPVTLVKTDLIEEYESCVWTERFIEAGDCNLIVPATHDNAVRLRPRNLILHAESDEPMHIETRSIKDGQITVVGKTLETFFNERSMQLVVGPDGDRVETPQGYLWAMLEDIAHRPILPVHNNLRFADYDEFMDPAYPNEMVTFRETEARPKAYDWALEIAKKYVVGMRIKRAWNEDERKFELVFVMRRPSDRTSGDRTVRLSSENDNFADIEEVYSIVDWVDIVAVWPPAAFIGASVDISGTGIGPYGPAYYPNTDFTGDENMLNYRVREFESEEFTVDFLRKRLQEYYVPAEVYGPVGTIWAWADLTDAQQIDLVQREMFRKAKDEYAKLSNLQKVVISGQLIDDVLTFGHDYRMGDIVKAKGDITGGWRKMMVTEYVRSFDGSGAKSHPTLVPPLVPESGEIEYQEGITPPPGGGTT
jgi:hypothetical protein